MKEKPANKEATTSEPISEVKPTTAAERVLENRAKRRSTVKGGNARSRPASILVYKQFNFENEDFGMGDVDQI